MNFECDILNRAKSLVQGFIDKRLTYQKLIK